MAWWLNGARSMIQKIFCWEDKRQVSLKMKYYFASLKPAWSKINYDNGMMWAASQHIQLQPSLGNKTNTVWLHLAALLSSGPESSAGWLDSVQSSAQEIIMKPSLVIYHSAVTIISQEILFHAQYTSLQWWQWYNISRTEGIKLELLLLEVTAISVIKSLKSQRKTRIEI